MSNPKNQCSCPNCGSDNIITTALYKKNIECRILKLFLYVCLATLLIIILNDIHMATKTQQIVTNINNNQKMSIEILLLIINVILIVLVSGVQLYLEHKTTIIYKCTKCGAQWDNGF